MDERGTPQRFDGFHTSSIAVGETTIYTRYGGSGPPLLLLHGMPETHLMWHRVAPRLAANFTVVAPDLPGYGASTGPASAADHAPYSKRALALDMVQLMAELGFLRFSIAGHDRGARVAYRLALDHPERVQRLAVLDIVPTGEALQQADATFARDFWLWFFLAQPADFPERLIAAAPRRFLDHMLDGWSARPDAFPAEVRDAYLCNLADPARVHAICEEYRAALTLDRAHDDADRGRRRIACPVLVLWSEAGALSQWYDPLTVWRGWADDVRGHALACGHFLPEEAPDATFAALNAFFSA
ncbi:MAG TPA: alpha/beta hydrolase [Dehalococcoidia bacterium]|nr:alpha/beta hydrolase [Dehalococcoidia bacterium]